MQVQSQFIEMFGDCQQLENLSSLCDTFIDGDWIESKDQSNEGIRLIQTGNVGNAFFKDKEDQCRFISNETFDKLHCTEIFPGDILVARLPDPIGRSCIIPDGLGRMITAVDCSIIRLKASILPYFFVAYTMTSTYSGQINEVTTGTTRRRVSRANLGNIKVPTPPTDQQKLFVSIAEQADKSKFVGFKSQFIEMFGNPITNTKGWATAKIKDVAPENPSKEQLPGKVWLLNLDMIESNTGKVIEKVYEDVENALSVQAFDEGNVLFSKLRPYLNKVVIPDEPGLATTELVPLRPEPSRLHKVFLSHLLRGSHFVNYANDISGGTKMPRMPLSELRNFECILPPMDLQRQFVSIAEQADKSKLIELSNKCYHKIYSIPTIQKKLLENGSPKATIETDESRSYFLIDIPCRKDFVQDDSILRQIDIHRVTINLMTKCPRYVQDMSKIEVEHLSVCILKSRTAVSAQIMLEGVDKVSYKQKRRKYLDKLLEMGVLLMTIPEKPTSRNQQYILSEYGKGLLE